MSFGEVGTLVCRLFLLVQALIFGVPVGLLVPLHFGGLPRFVPFAVGANHCRLRHIGRESASEAFLNELLQLFHFPPRSAPALLARTLPLRYCAVRIASKTATWRLPVLVHAASPGCH